ncbi:Inositol-3-phosphate synthase [Streptomyces sp. 111WW2]|uniref:inositol-3-phosphate synthase n=1 Tax=Streptomyces sp. 111WW2 TaxID=1945515 RepID=UPI000D0C778C|nr:inositol-3-phosphate synthase [Streptomyces sp. 111WW2]PSK57962.1 Inositol-3-phosphate synthase [Streptomyces sp. 111WW2]
MTRTVRIGIIGVGNCARALLEGVAYYSTHPEETAGLSHPVIGGYTPAAVVPAAAWDVDVDKVGYTLWEARTRGQNLDVGIPQDELKPIAQDVRVSRGPALDGAGSKYRERITVAEPTVDPEAEADRIRAEIRTAGVQVLVNYLPVGSQAATEWWAQIALDTGTAFVNNIPVFIARNETWRARFRRAGLPLIGDDIKSQLGATYVHRVLARAFSDRGITLDRTYQLNVGGNMDFYNMLEADRLATKRVSKSSAVTDAYAGALEPGNVHIGPSDFVPWLGDSKKAFIRCEGRGFAGAPIELEMQLTVPDSPNSAGIVIDAVRIAKTALDRDEPDADAWASAWLFKAPPREVADDSDTSARHRLDTWLTGA